MNKNKAILKFQRDCYLNYIPFIRKSIPEFPHKYVYPDGNPIKPVVPVQTNKNNIMLIGAFPSARFERRNSVLIPIGDNLSPFSEEKYFDGWETRVQESREGLNENYFKRLKIKAEDLWITDIVKIYLFPEKHIKNCRKISKKIKFFNTHKLFKKIAEAGRDWIIREVDLCNPKLIITIGEVSARVITSNYKINNKKLLNGEIKNVILNKNFNIAHLPHPEIMRRNKEWKTLSVQAIDTLGSEINAKIR